MEINGIGIHSLQDGDADILYLVIAAGRQHLTNMVWAADATLESTRAYFANLDPAVKVFVVTYHGSQQGVVTLWPVEHGYSLGYWLGPAYRGRGVMRQAVGMALLTLPRLTRVVATIREKNTASRQVLRCNRFTVINEEMRNGEKWLDLIRFTD